MFHGFVEQNVSIFRLVIFRLFILTVDLSKRILPQETKYISFSSVLIDQVILKSIIFHLTMLSDPLPLALHHRLRPPLLRLRPHLQRRLRGLHGPQQHPLLGHAALHGHSAVLVHLPPRRRPGIITQVC